MSKIIRFGILGCSNVAKNSFIPALLKSKKTSLEFIGSRSKQKQFSFSKKFHCKKFGTYEDVLSNNNVDIVYISLPPALQEKWVILAARSKKHIICEKSISISYTSAKKMIDECKKNNVRIMESFSFLYHPQHDVVINSLKHKKIGIPFFLDAKFGFTLTNSTKNFRLEKKLGGGILNDVACYIIKISSTVFQGLPTSVLCNLTYDKKHKVDVRGSIFMTFKNNKTTTGFFGYSNSFQSCYEIWGKTGLITVERAFNLHKNNSGKISFSTGDDSKTFTISPSDQFQLMIEDFCSCILKKTKLNPENSILKQAFIMDCARKSASKMKLIKIGNSKQFLDVE
jgi:predicted dehydrogenase